MTVGFLPVEGDEGTLRDAFHRLANAREDPACLIWAKDWLLGLLADVDFAQTPEAPFVPLPDGGLALGDLQNCPPPFCKGGQGGLNHAPLALLEGAWLQAVAVAGNGHRAAETKLFAAYLALLGSDEGHSPAAAYRGWLAQAGVSLPQPCAWRFAHDPRIGTPALYFASVQLALGIHAASLFPEALGFTLAYAGSSSPWRLPALPHRLDVLQAVARHSAAALDAYLEAGGEWARVRRGHALYQAAEADYLAGLEQAPLSTGEQVAELFRRKRRFARGYHAHIRLAGRALEDWFAEEPFDAPAFLDAFAASPFAEGEAGQRPFDRLLAFGGPMFGVFDADEAALIDAWLEQRGSPEAACPDASAKALLKTNLKAPLPLGEGLGVRVIDNRSLFHRLLQPEPQHSLAAARRRVEQALAPARHATRRSLPDYSPSTFAAQIEQIHAQAVAAYRPLQRKPKLSRDDYAWGIRQFAPAILVDGCWLQHQGDAAHQDQRVRRLLHRIYAEELGAGRTDWNHPNIYRDLLKDLGIDLPATDSASFAHDPGFLDAAFDLPSYLLAISQFPNTYLPETLGLNLAIELSGLGGGYMRLAEEFRHWHINPLIVTLHLSIDNLASGHAAMAAEAIQIYLDEIRLLAGDAATQDAWQRVWAGYLSLGTVTRKFKWALLWGGVKRRILGVQSLLCMRA